MRLTYFKNNTCSVCNALLPKIVRMASNYKLPLEILDVNEHPALAGQNLIFTVPVIIVFDVDGKEIKRFVRNFSEFEVKNFLERVLKYKHA
ncbi:MAG: thioredoxin family protein [Bacteroidales bacterium]|nr:thioredoxin family protein [Bacteroidales bacterium]